MFLALLRNTVKILESTAQPLQTLTETDEE